MRPDELRINLTGNLDLLCIACAYHEGYYPRRSWMFHETSGHDHAILKLSPL